jgi:hypothetical protein
MSQVRVLPSAPNKPLQTRGFHLDRVRRKAPSYHRPYHRVVSRRVPGVRRGCDGRPFRQPSEDRSRPTSRRSPPPRFRQHIGGIGLGMPFACPRRAQGVRLQAITLLRNGSAKRPRRSRRTITAYLVPRCLGPECPMRFQRPLWAKLGVPRQKVMLFCHTRVRHAVEAVEDAVCVLTIARGGEG